MCQINVEYTGHNFKKTSRARRALVIHLEVQNFPLWPNRDNFTVLTADINDRADRRAKMTGAFGVAGNFRDFIRVTGKIAAAVTGSDDTAFILKFSQQFFGRDTHGFRGLLHGLFKSFNRTVGRANNGGAKNAEVLI